MKVTVLNPDNVTDLFSHWGRFSAVCYDTKTNSPEKIGKHCLESEHFSGSRSTYIEFMVEECPRFLIDQLIRKEIGACKNVQSFRYVDKSSFAYEIPVEIKDNKALVDRYINHMREAMELYEDIQSYVLSKGKSKERANEQARYVLPMSNHGTVVIGMTVECFIEFCYKRLCVRTEDIHHQLAILMRNEVVYLLPELSEYLVPKCVYLTWCPEKNSCGRYPKKTKMKLGEIDNGTFEIQEANSNS